MAKLIPSTASLAASPSESVHNLCIWRETNASRHSTPEANAPAGIRVAELGPLHTKKRTSYNKSWSQTNARLPVHLNLSANMNYGTRIIEWEQSSYITGGTKHCATSTKLQRHLLQAVEQASREREFPAQWAIEFIKRAKGKHCPELQRLGATCLHNMSYASG